MRSRFLIGAIVAVGAAAMAWAATDPVLMTINGKQVRLSEFEYLYNKNNQQQENEESIDQYVDRFVNYKLKVADAEAEGYDTLTRVKREISDYRNDILGPFINDTVCRDRLIDESYDFMATNVDINHIMLPLGKDEAETRQYEARLDSIRQCALNGEDFEELTVKHSAERAKMRHRGHYGYVRGESGLPYAFEKVAWNTPVGEISKPFRTAFGVHLVKVNGRKPDEGRVEVQQLLLLFGKDATDEKKLAVKHRADSIYQLVLNGESFDDLVKRFSDDPTTKTSGGRLRPFGIGQMAAKFQEAAFRLQPGEVSEPLEMEYGYHIVKKLAQYPLGTRAEERKNIMRIIEGDERAMLPRQSKIDQVREQLKVKKNPKLHKALVKLLKKNGGYTPEFVTQVLPNCNETAFTYANGIKVPISKVASKANPNAKFDLESGAAYIESFVEPLITTEVMQHYTDNIMDLNPDFRNLYNEYRDGTLLYEVSQKKVWNRASGDATGLEEFYNENPGKYTWDKPHFKAIMVYVTNDSIYELAQEIIRTHEGEHIDSIAVMFNKAFHAKVRMERVLAAEGENAKVDYVAFGGKKVPSGYNRYPIYFALGGKIINQPESFNDVKGEVTSDYQDKLEADWIKELHSKYQVKIDRKVLEQAKANAARHK